MSPARDTQSLLRLMAWLSPAFPVGGFAYSAGLERAVHDGLVTNATSLSAWLSTVLEAGTLWNDAVLLTQASLAADDVSQLAELSDLGLALAGSAERHLETLSLGRAFLSAAAAWPHAVFERLPRDCPYPVAVGAVASAHGIAAEQALAAFLHAAVSQGISAGIRLGVCGQQQGVAILSDLEARVSTVAERAAGSTLDDFGTSTVQADIASMRHETQHSRLFRS